MERPPFLLILLSKHRNNLFLFFRQGNISGGLVNSLKILQVSFISLLCVAPLQADDVQQMKRQITDLEKRVAALEQQLTDIGAKDRWKDRLLWQRIKKEMPASDVRKLLGKPARVQEQIFDTWYYHPTSKLHGYVWFDEDRVLGWELPE